MGELWRRLGKFVQGLLDKIFGKKNNKPQNPGTKSWTNITSTDMKLGAGEVPLGKVESITSISKNDIPNETWESLKSIFGDGEINGGWVEIPSQAEIQKNFFSTPLTLLPKRYWVKTLILTLAANQSCDYQAVDLSQYEERGLAHFIVGRTTGLKELMDEYLMEQTFDSEEEAKEEQEWLAEELEQAGESGLFSSVVGKATLLYYEELGVWSFEVEDEDE
jgi:hypothetical protein